MSASAATSSAEIIPKGYFATTHWSLVLSAIGGQSQQAQCALETLCRSYWYPLYAYVRWRGYGPEDAEDLTQEFFARLLKHNWLAAADKSKGRFRSFLLMVLKRFLANERDKVRARKRAGGMKLVPLSLDIAESRFAGNLAKTNTPEEMFDRQWALTVLDQVLSDLRAEYMDAGKVAVFDVLKPCLVGSRETQPYAELAATLGLTEGAVKTAVFRLRERYRRRLKEEIAHTVASPSEVESELRHLFRALAAG